jgi:hypothetical protein
MIQLEHQNWEAIFFDYHIFPLKLILKRMLKAIPDLRLRVIKNTQWHIIDI